MVGALGLVAAACGSPDLTPTGAAATSTSFTTTTLPGAPDDTGTSTTSTPPTSTTSTSVDVGPPGTADPGLTADTIRIAVIADVTSGEIGDQIFLPAWQGIDAWATAVNQFGGLAGRRVEVEFIDSAVVDHAEAIQTVCNGDFFALVGTQALFDGEGVEVLDSPACGIPDFPSAAYSAARRNSEVTFLPNPLLNDIVQVGPAAALAELDPLAVATTATFFTGLPVFDLEVERALEGALSVGYEFVYDPTVEFDEDFAPIVDAMAGLEVSAVQWVGTGQRLADLLTAIDATAAAGGEPSVDLAFVNCSTLCYTPAIENLGAAAAGVTVWMPHLPLDEVESNAELNAYQFWLNVSARDEEVRDPHPVGVAAWAAGRLFEDAVNRAIGRGTASENNGRLTRDAVIAAARTLSSFDANGLYAEPSNPAAGVPTPCFVLVRWSGSRWERLYPTLEGTADCSPSNLFLLEDTTDLGVEQPTDGG